MDMNINEQEQKLIMDYIKEYGPNHHRRLYNWSSLDTILNEWNWAKNEYLYQMFGDKLILEREVSYPVSYNDKLRLYRQKCNERDSAIDIFNTLFEKMYEWIREKNYESQPAYFGVCHYGAAWNILFSTDHQLENRMSDHYKDYIARRGVFKIVLPDNKNLVIDANTRPIRALGKIAKAFGHEKEFENYRIAMSQISNCDNLKGTLCLSIHPLDYMTMSDNDNNWHSCMSWKHCGEYRGGTVEMMNSPMVVVAYLKSNNSTMENGWNNKKWRTLAIVNKHMITTIKNYPYYHAEMTKDVVAWLMELAEEKLDWTYGEPDFFDAEDHNDYYFTTNAMYNDMENGPDSFGAFVKRAPSLVRRKEICYSGTRTCMCCGDTMQWDDYDESDLLCDNCD